MSSGTLKMVKIRVTGENTFVWMSAKYRSDHSLECEAQLTFSEDCFQGNVVGQANYNVQLAAVAKSGKINHAKSTKKISSCLEIKLGTIFKTIILLFTLYFFLR